MGHYVLNYPIETPEAIAFWDSEHKANTAKAYVAFSLDEQNFREITKRAGYTRAWRDRMWEAFGIYVNQPDMTAIPFSQMSDLWWNEMPTPTLHTFTFPTIVPEPMPTPDPDPELPVITVAATDQVGVDGGSVTFTTNATDYLAVQWYRGSYPIPGETSPTLTFTPTYHDHCVIYTAVYMNADGYSSTRAQLTVLNGNPDITLQPLGGRVDSYPGGFILYSDGTGQTSIKWEEQDRDTLQWGDVQGVIGNDTNKNITISTDYTGLYKSFRVKYINSIGTTVSQVSQVFAANETGNSPIIDNGWTGTVNQWQAIANHPGVVEDQGNLFTYTINNQTDGSVRFRIGHNEGSAPDHWVDVSPMTNVSGSVESSKLGEEPSHNGNIRVTCTSAGGITTGQLDYQFYRGESLTPFVGATYSHSVTFGTVGAGQVGYDALPTEEGDLVPDNLAGFTVEQLLTNNAGSQLQLGIGGQNASAITISVPSYGPETFSFIWLSGLWRVRTTENPTAGPFLAWWHSRTNGEVHDIDLILTP